MQPSPPYLPVITVITDSSGHSLRPADELRIMPGLTMTYVTGDGPDRIELSPTPPTYQPLDAYAYQKELPALGGSATILAIASDEGDAHIELVELCIADGSVTADDIDYRILNLVTIDPVTGTPSLVVRVTTETAPTGTGDWTPLLAAFTTGPFTLPASHRLVVVWEADGAGVVIPNGVYRIRQ